MTTSPNNTNNLLKFKYCRGLGDIIAVFLHSKAIGWLTHLITGKTTPCAKCSKRANALNVLFPIALWKWFFYSEEEMIMDMRKDLESSGFTVSHNEKTNNFSAIKIEELQKPIPSSEIDPISSSYILVSSGQNFIGEFRIDTQIYKK
jgi:hypothetical protein